MYYLNVLLHHTLLKRLSQSQLLPRCQEAFSQMTLFNFPYRTYPRSHDTFSKPHGQFILSYESAKCRV